MNNTEIYNQIIEEESITFDKLKEAVLIHAMDEYRKEILEKRIMVTDLIDYVVKTKDVTREALLGRTRRREVVESRQIIWYLLRNGILPIKFSLMSMGQLFGRDHATTIHGIKAIEEMITVDTRLRNDIMMMANNFGFHTSWNPNKKILEFA